MDRKADGEGNEFRFSSYVEHIASSLGHADRRTPFRSYCAGLILPGDRKSVEPIAARIEPHRVQGAHQSLHHFVANADWSQEDLLRRVRAFVVPAIEQSGRISALIVDDTGFPEEGRSFGGRRPAILRQLGKQDNCQVAVSLSVANEHTSLPIAFRLYLPEDWAADRVRRAKAGVPADVVFKTKPQIALDQIKAARAEGVPEGVVLADAGYGINTAFRMALTRMGLTYVVGIQSSAQLWAAGIRSAPAQGMERARSAPTLMRRDEQNKPQWARQLAKSLSADAWRDVAWREGVENSALPVRQPARAARASRLTRPPAPSPREWLIVEWPQGESAPTKYWLSTLPADADLETLVATAKMRWRIERDYQELKQELGLDHYEGRGWEAFTTTWRSGSAAYGFLVSERSSIPPSGDKILLIQAPRLSQGYRPADPPIRAERQTKASISQPSALNWPAASHDACRGALLPTSQLMTQ